MKRTALAVWAALSAAPWVSADTVTLTTGEVLEGTVTDQDDTTVTLMHPVLGEMPIPAVSVTEVLTDPAEAGDEVGEAGQASDEAPVAPAGRGFFEGWSNRFEAGLSGASGNSENVSLYLATTSTRETEQDRDLFTLRYAYAKSEGTSSTNQFSAFYRHDWLVPEEDYFYFGDVGFDWDQFQAWDSRILGHLGAGYRWVEEEDYTLDLLAGLGAIREFGSSNDDIIPEGLLGFDVAWQISEHQSFTWAGRFFPDFNDFGDFRLTNELAWNMNIPDTDNMTLSLGISHEYDSKSTGPVRKNDVLYFATIGFDF